MEAKLCDYSLEAYKSQDAEVGAKYKLHRFPSGTFGLQVEGTANEYGCGTAACLKEGSRLLVSGIASTCPAGEGMGPVEEVIFVKVDKDANTRHHDAVRFSNDRIVTLQSLGAGAEITLLSLPEEKLEQPHVEAPEMVDAD
jgi:hypothetical protein